MLLMDWFHCVQKFLHVVFNCKYKLIYLNIKFLKGTFN